MAGITTDDATVKREPGIVQVKCGLGCRIITTMLRLTQFGRSERVILRITPG
ncbi:MAG: hypothetical protein H0U40_03570 [Chloroflexia bacterium]|nr:hypothetical protein [Chloroflexia bacterium]